MPNELEFAHGRVGGRVRLMVMRECLPVKGSKRMAWKYDDECGACGQVELKNMCCLTVTNIEKIERSGTHECMIMMS